MQTTTEATLSTDRQGIPTARRLKAERAVRGWNQDALAAEAGVARITVANIETNRFSPRGDTRAKVAKALGLEVGDLWAGRTRAV